MQASLDEKFRRLFDRLPHTLAVPELAYGTLPTAVAIRAIELQRGRPEASMDKITDISPEEVLGSDRRAFRADVLEALQTGSLELPRLAFLPTHGEVIGVLDRFEDKLRQQGLTQGDLLLLSPRQFEELIAEIFERFGWEVELTAQTRDKGRDVVAIRRTNETHSKYLVECKRFGQDRKVGVELIRQLYGVKIHERTTKALLATTSTFTRDASKFIDEHLWELEGRDYQNVIEWVRKVSER